MRIVKSICLFFYLFEREAYALFLYVHAYYHRLYLLTYFEHVGRMFYIAVGYLRYVNEAVLMYAYIHECAEVDYVADGTVDHHSYLQIFNAHDVLAELGCGK